MFLSAAKFAVVLSTATFQAASLPRKEVSVWNQIRPAIVTLVGHGHATGVAALIDDSGYFVAHSSSVVGPQVVGKDFIGKQISFSIVSQDKATMLVLLKTNSWVSGSAQPLRMPQPGEIESGNLIAALPTGPIRLAYGTRHKLGVMNTTRRLVPLTEMRFEAIPELVGGALIFSETGELIGSLNATLVGQDSGMQRSANVFGGRGGAGSGQGWTLNNNNGGFGQGANQAIGQGGPGRAQYNNAGPNEMTVAYTVSTDFVRHVVDGFLSPSHKPEFAVLGIFCIDAVGGGALIQQVTPGLPADKAGIRAGDVLLNIGGTTIDDQITFAKVMLQKKVGQPFSIIVQRGPGKILIDNVVPAKAAD